MTSPALSPAAQLEFDRRTPRLIDGENWNFAYIDFLKELAGQEVYPLADVEVKGQGIAALKKSHEDHRIEVELKAYAAHELGPDISAALSKLPPHASLDEFLDHLMPSAFFGREVRMNRFKMFLTHEAEMEVDEQMELFPKDITREDRVARMALVRLEGLEHTGLCAELQHMFIEGFRSWWKSQEEGNPLGTHNETRKVGVSERHAALAALLPSRPDKPGMSKEDWRSAAEKKGLISSTRTFNRDVADMVRKGLVQDQENGCFRKPKK
jgi:hypothetical protein